MQGACQRSGLLTLCRLTSAVLTNLDHDVLPACRCVFRAHSTAREPCAASASGCGLQQPAGRQSTEQVRPGSRLNPGNSPRRTARQPPGAPDQPTSPEKAGASCLAASAAQPAPYVDQQRLLASTEHDADATGAGGSGKNPPAAAPAASMDTDAIDSSGRAEAHPAEPLSSPSEAEVLGAEASGSSHLHSSDLELSGTAGPTEERAESFFSSVFRLQSSSVVGVMSKTAVRQQVSMAQLPGVSPSLQSFPCCPCKAAGPTFKAAHCSCLRVRWTSWSPLSSPRDW